MIGRLLRQPWVFSFGAAIAVWLATIAYTEGQGAGAIEQGRHLEPAAG